MLQADYSKPQTGALEWPSKVALPIDDPAALPAKARGLTRFIAPSISVAVLIAVLAQFRHIDFTVARGMLPTSVAFWAVFVCYYFVQPAADFVIFRRLWKIPSSGFLALVRKNIGNEILLGYIGEVYFYGWARRRTDITGAPFGAVKDVAILSAMVGNVVTIVMLALAYPLLDGLHLGIQRNTLVLSITIVLVTSMAIMFFRQRLFSLPRRELRFVTLVHFIRVLVMIGLTARMWHLVLPGVELSWWLLLAVLRQLLSRLPLLPNKDLVFAGLAVFLIGRDVEIATLMAMMAMLLLAAHVTLGAILGVSEFFEMRSRKVAVA